MQPFFADYLNNLEELHAEILHTISGLPQDAFDWTPFPGGNSLSVLIVHLTGAERYWFSDVVAGVPSGRDRESEFMVKNLKLGELTARLQESLSYGAQVLENLDLIDLEAKRRSSRSDRDVSVTWALEHALKHTAVHLGHIQITRQLWDMHRRD
jgi:uncharacterized damage-inducible protein DinB